MTGGGDGAEASTTAPLRIAPKVYEHIRALLRAGKIDEAIATSSALAIIRPDDLAAKELLFDGFFQKHEWLPALMLAEELVRRRPEVARLQKSLIATLSNMKRYKETIAQAHQYIARHGEDLNMLDALKVAYFYTGQIDEAVRYGQRGIELRDAAACVNAAPPLDRPKRAPSGENVISFSLWGKLPAYAYGAMINLALSRTVYPGWICRFYIAEDVPRRCVDYLRDNGAQIRNIEDEYPGVGSVQRFLVMNDRKVGRFLVRDCDARLSSEEAELVKEWIDSKRPFHVIRDHVLHNDLVLAGLWGGRTDCGIDIVDLLRRYFLGGPNAKYGEDQRMLGATLWPLIRGRCLVHDKHYHLPGVVEGRKVTGEKSHFGAGHRNTAAVLKEVETLKIPRILDAKASA
jgi:tetratricopeptide (TPR) repeat protein